MVGRFNEHGYRGTTSLFCAVLPAADTKRMSFAPSRSIASDNACEKPVPGQVAESLNTLTFTPACLLAMTQSMAVIRSLVAPVALAPTHLTAMMLVLQATPVTPAPLFPTAPTIPATCEPCPPKVL